MVNVLQSTRHKETTLTYDKNALVSGEIALEFVLFGTIKTLTSTAHHTSSLL